MLRLRVESPGGGEPQVFHLTGRDALVGRDAGADVVVSDGTVSGRHALLRAGDGGYRFTDLGSRNGSAFQARGEPAPRPIAAGEEVPIGPGDVLLLGALDRPVVVRVEEALSAFAPPAAARSQRTIVAASPLLDLLVAPPDALSALAAEVVSASSPDDLAESTLAFARRLFPNASGVEVRVSGAGFEARAGDEAPRGIAGVALDGDEVVLVTADDETLPESGSVAAAGIRAAVVGPLRAGGAAHGHVVVWSALGTAALPERSLEPLAVGATLVGLAASTLAVRARGEEAGRRATGPGAAHPEDPIGTSPSFVRAVSMCRQVAPADVPVLLLGETGSGKEVLARALHRWSRRATKPFVAFNCAAVPESLLESELFGHVRGSFTGAVQDRPGLFEEAHGGTVFLDEIGEMPASMQAKLLRVLQEGEVRRVGATKTATVDVRVVSATHRDLEALVAEGRFRADLMYRLNAVAIRIPPLRERREDIPLLAHHLLGRATASTRRRVPGFSPEALAALLSAPFPGNVRQLENEVLRAVALTPEGSPIRPDAFSPAVSGTSSGSPQSIADGGCGASGPVTLRDAVEAAERAALRAALERAGGNVSQAARDLGLTRPGLYKVMERLGLRR